MNVCKKSTLKFSLFQKLLRFKVFYCSLLFFYCLDRIFGKLRKTWYFPKMDTIFRFLMSNMIIMSLCIYRTQLFKKLSAFLCYTFRYLEMGYAKSIAGVTSQRQKIGNSNQNNFWNNENFDVLFFANIHNFLRSTRLHKNIHSIKSH